MAMTPAVKKRLFRGGLIAFAALCAVWLARLNYAEKISTNVLDLIPMAEQAPEIALIRSFANDIQARVMLFALEDSRNPGVPPVAAAELLTAELRRSPLFPEAVVVGDDSAQTAMGRQIFDHRFELLLPTWLGQHARRFAQTGQPAANYSAWLAEQSAAELEHFLSRPEAVALQDLALIDPLLLVPGLIDRARGLSAPGSAAHGHALVWARITPSPLAESGQGPVFAAVEAAFARVRAAHPGIALRWTGINRFAAASRARMRPRSSAAEATVYETMSRSAMRTSSRSTSHLTASVLSRCVLPVPALASTHRSPRSGSASVAGFTARPVVSSRRARGARRARRASR